MLLGCLGSVKPQPAMSSGDIGSIFELLLGNSKIMPAAERSVCIQIITACSTSLTATPCCALVSCMPYMNPQTTSGVIFSSGLDRSS